LDRLLTQKEVVFIFVITFLISFVVIGFFYDNFSSDFNLSPFSLGGGTATRVTSGQSGIDRVPATPPGIPQNFIATLGQEQIGLSWSASMGQVDGYNIYKDSQSQFANPVWIGNVSGSDLDFVDIEMFMGETAFYAVTAFNSAGESGYSVVRQGRVNANYGMRWSYPSDGSWLAELVTFGNNDGNAFTQYGPQGNHEVLFDSQDLGIAGPLFDYTDNHLDPHLVRSISASANSDVYVSMALIMNYSNDPNYGEVILEKFSSSSIGSNVPDWKRTIPSQFFNGDENFGVKVSDDGSKILVWIWNSQTSNIDYYVINSQSPSQTLSPLGSVSGLSQSSFATVSGDLTRGVFVFPYSSVKLVDFNSGVEKTIFTIARFVSGADLTFDGSTIGFVKNSHPQVSDAELYLYSFQGNDFAELNRILIPSDVKYGDLKLSADGSRVVYVYFNKGQSSPYIAGVVAADTNNPSQAVYQHEYLVDSSLGNYVSSLSINDAGTKAAVGYWGDEFDQTSEIKIHNFVSQGIDAEFFTVGSVNGLDMSSNGAQIVVALKGGHAGEWGGSGEINAYDLP